MESNKMKWFTDYQELERHKQELLWMIEDLRKTSQEELNFEIEKDKLKTIENKDKIEYNWQGKRLLFKQPYKNE